MTKISFRYGLGEYDFLSHLGLTPPPWQVVSALLSAGADTELYTATGCCGTALHLAAALADVTMCEVSGCVEMDTGGHWKSISMRNSSSFLKSP